MSNWFQTSAAAKSSGLTPLQSQKVDGRVGPLVTPSLPLAGSGGKGDDVVVVTPVGKVEVSTKDPPLKVPEGSGSMTTLGGLKLLRVLQDKKLLHEKERGGAAGKKGKGVHPSRGLSSKSTGAVYEMDVLTPIVGLTNASGVYSSLTGGALLSALPDFTSLASLFDTVRCKGITFRHQPRGMGQTPASFAFLHQPLIICGDDDAVTALNFATLCQRDQKDRRNAYHNTGIPWKHGFGMKKAVNAASTTPASSVVNMATWMDTNMMANATGGALLAIQTDTINVTSAFGTMLVAFHCEWSTRL